MSKDRMENIANFVDVSFDELANADIKIFNGIKAIFRVVRSGKNVIDGENNTDYNKFKENLKRELKKLASFPKTDENHLREILKNMKLFFDDEESLINYYKNKEELVRKIRDNTNIPRESELPSDFADIIINNITKLIINILINFLLQFSIKYIKNIAIKNVKTVFKLYQSIKSAKGI